MAHDTKTRGANRRNDAADIELPPELDRERAIDIRQLESLTGLAAITIRQRMARGADLPRYFRVGRSVRWRLGDVLDWRDARTVGKVQP